MPDPSTGRGLVFAGVPGLVRSAMLEVPDRFRLIEVLGTAFDDLDESVRAAALAVEEPAVVIRDGAVFLPRLTRAATTESATPSATWDSSGTVLITGGTGGWVVSSLGTWWSSTEFGICCWSAAEVWRLTAPRSFAAS